MRDGHRSPRGRPRFSILASCARAISHRAWNGSGSICGHLCPLAKSCRLLPPALPAEGFLSVALVDFHSKRLKSLVGGDGEMIVKPHQSLGKGVGVKSRIEPTI